MTMPASPAGFLSDPPVDADVQELYDGDREGLGYVANLSRVWAQCPTALKTLSSAMMLATDLSGLEADERSLVVLATASTMGDSYCSLAYGARLASAIGEDVTARVVRGDDSRLTPRGQALAAWAREVARDPSATTPEGVRVLREAGLGDRQIFGLTLFAALRIVFSSVNDALGACPDAELAAKAPHAVLEAIDFGRLPATAAATTD